MSNKVSFIKTFIEMGIAIIPLYHRSKSPMLASWDPFKNRLPTHTEYQSWFATDWHNYGVVAGWKNLTYLDFDDMNSFAMWMDWFLLLNKHTEIYPMPFIVATSRGAHVYLSMPNRGANHKRKGCEVKFNGYVCGPMSVHPSGAIYQPMTDLRLIEVFSLETILPTELFPVISQSETASRIAPVPMQLLPTEYDPFQAASQSMNIDLITKVKGNVRIENLFSNVHKTSTDGRWLSTLCLFHDDHHPSMWIDTKLQICGCNVCNFKPLDAINLYAKMHNISESLAVSEMARELGIWR